MWKHSVMEDVFDTKLPEELYERLEKSVEFYLGGPFDFKETPLKDYCREICLDENGEIYRLPFENTLFSYMSGHNGINGKIALMCFEASDKSIAICPFICRTKRDGFGHVPVRSFIMPDGGFEFSSWMRLPAGELRQSAGTELMNITMVVAKALGMLNAKNVIAEVVEPDGMEARNRKRAKKGQTLLEPYHVLKFRPGKSGKMHEHGGVSLTEGDAMACHLVRGHLKTYTAEAPLFGKIVGRYWWQAHMAGNGSPKAQETAYDMSAVIPHD